MGAGTKNALDNEVGPVAARAQTPTLQSSPYVYLWSTASCHSRRVSCMHSGFDPELFTCRRSQGGETASMQTAFNDSDLEYQVHVLDSTSSSVFDCGSLKLRPTQGAPPRSPRPRLARSGRRQIIMRVRQSERALTLASCPACGIPLYASVVRRLAP